MIYNFCGENKGKTSSALGCIIRALGLNKKVRVVFFMKNWVTSETLFFDKIKEIFDIDYFLAGSNEFLTTKKDILLLREKLKHISIKEVSAFDKEKAHKGLLKAYEYLDENPFLIVLDEINYALEFNLLSLDELIEFLKKSQELDIHVIITGKKCFKELEPFSDLITQMKKIKHPFDKDILAIKGLDF